MFPSNSRIGLLVNECVSCLLSSFLPSARSGPTTTDHALIEKHPKDQQSNENTTRAVRP
jgi:hypothetical protein